MNHLWAALLSVLNSAKCYINITFRIGADRRAVHAGTPGRHGHRAATVED